MSKKTLYLLGILLTGIIGAIFNWFLCCPPGGVAVKSTKSPVISPVTVPEVPSATSNGFALSDALGGFDYRSNDHFNFNGSNFSILTPVSENVDVGVEKLKAYLEANPEKALNIYGHYTSKETNPSAYPNLGVARANAIKNYLVGKGLSSKHIDTFGKLDDSLVPEGNIYLGPASYTFETAASEEDDSAKLKALKDEITAHPLVLHFESNSDQLNLSSEQRNKMAKISTYLDKVDNAKVSVVGHTDATGDPTLNTKLGLERANSIKEYLVNNGISGAKIETESKGPHKPVATNATAEGRAENRRVEVSLK